MNNTNRESQDDSLLNGVPYQAGSESTRQTRRWRWLATPTLALAMALMLPSRGVADEHLPATTWQSRSRIRASTGAGPAARRKRFVRR